MNPPLLPGDQMRTLEQIQEVDLKIDGLKRRKAQLPVKLKSIHEDTQKLKLKLSIKKAALEEMEKLSRQTQAALDLNQDRLNRSSVKLDAVQNSQEYLAATKEIDQLKKLTASLEEQLKKAQTEFEGIKKEFADIESELEIIQIDLEEKTTLVNSESAQLDIEIQNLTQARNQCTHDIEKRVLVQYDRIRAARGGLGLVPVTQGRCNGCHMMIPPQLYNEIQKGNHVHYCPSCHRIVFIPTLLQSQPPNDQTTPLN
ncbi:MAG: hypothetical protein HY843_06865 [Bdellovibrio sp.]|nr:hypothetical protein [Bdellovibrio sp.]